MLIPSDHFYAATGPAAIEHCIVPDPAQSLIAPLGSRWVLALQSDKKRLLADLTSRVLVSEPGLLRRANFGGFRSNLSSAFMGFSRCIKGPPGLDRTRFAVLLLAVPFLSCLPAKNSYMP